MTDNEDLLDLQDEVEKVIMRMLSEAMRADIQTPMKSIRLTKGKVTSCLKSHKVAEQGATLMVDLLARYQVVSQRNAGNSPISPDAVDSAPTSEVHP